MFVGGRGRGSTSRVPDHVKHPERYTCYVLDEPLVVGGGGDQGWGRDEDRVRRVVGWGWGWVWGDITGCEEFRWGGKIIGCREMSRLVVVVRLPN